ncbi:phosphatidic acid phosphatase type 2/haloperoxidase [Bombardia bombarda]|uniref:Phosphatidic acid phosphatase type 2/haloperoxidase n=1 Tax=Bombardia bombarda TaxID=252184 RepID=A0AA39X8K7_9PEZI|nr:phosphatidic acid phosphatase type 2/haloperoxidase [Bombardia bombarda]
MAPPRVNSSFRGANSSGGNGNNGSGDGGSRSSALLGSVSRFWHRSYASDYIGFALLLTSYFIIQFFVEPFHRLFSLNDLRIAFPHAEVERVPVSYCFAYALLTPLIFMLVCNLATGASAHKHHVSLLGLLIALILTSLLTDIIKNTVGRPRPDLLARCLPAPKTPATSFSFAGLGYLSLFLTGQMRIFSYGPGSGNAGGGGGGSSSSMIENTEKLVRGDLLRGLLCLGPLLGATMIAISRCQDYRHDVYDVSIGALLGWTVTYWTYRRYWPRVSSARCDEPHAGPPAAEAASARYGRLRDEEERVGLGEQQNVGFELDRF